MRKFHIHGADAKTGQEREIFIQAQFEDDALEEARRKGILASSVSVVSDSQPRQPAPAPAATADSRAKARPASPQSTAVMEAPVSAPPSSMHDAPLPSASQVPAPPVNRRPPAAPSPDYHFLLICAASTIAMGVVCIVIGAMIAFNGIHSTEEDRLVVGFGFICGGVLYASLGEGLRTFRDMARNSYRS